MWEDLGPPVMQILHALNRRLHNPLHSKNLGDLPAESQPKLRPTYVDSSSLEDLQWLS